MRQLDKVAKILKLPTADNAETLIAMIKTELTDKERRKTADMTAYHIGLLSLGFCHSKHFKPMCRKCNSAKNNRFTKADVGTLIALERQGEQVVSWHSKYI